MRFLILLVFGGMGGLVIWLGWVKYQTVTNQVRTWPQAGGIVRQVTEDGYAAEYRVDEETHRAAAGKWLGWPKVEDGDPVRVVYDPQSPAAGKVNAWQEVYQEAILLAFLGSIGLFLGIGGSISLGGAMEKLEAVSKQTARAWEAEYDRAPVMSLGEGVELRHPPGVLWMMGIGAIIAFGAGIGLFRAPDILWTKFLAWPAAGVAIFIGVMIVAAAIQTRTTVLRADANGMREESKWSKKEVAWTQVVKIVRLRRTKREYSQTSRRYSTRTVGYTWILSDRNGAELMKIDEDMEPAEARTRLLRYIPGRTGLTVEEKTE